jgi:hypothetical protein
MTAWRPYLVGLSWFSFLLLWTACEKPYGEYDDRDIPSSIHISAKTEGNLHAHATAIFQATTRIPFVCTGAFNQGLTDRDSTQTEVAWIV